MSSAQTVSFLIEKSAAYGILAVNITAMEADKNCLSFRQIKSFIFLFSFYI